MGLTARDRELLRRCLHHEPGAWSDFVERFLGLVYHVIQHTANLRTYPLAPADAEDLASQAMLQIIDNDYAVLRQFRGQASLATYLTVVVRRVVVQELFRRAQAKDAPAKPAPEPEAPAERPSLELVEEVGRLLKRLPTKERAVVRLYYLEGRTYEEISDELDVPVNSVGSILSRARKKLKAEENGESE